MADEIRSGDSKVRVVRYRALQDAPRCVAGDRPGQRVGHAARGVNAGGNSSAAPRAPG
jgi:hypothetical protein